MYKYDSTFAEYERFPKREQQRIVYQVNVPGFSPSYYDNRADAESMSARLRDKGIAHTVRRVGYWRRLAKLWRSLNDNPKAVNTSFELAVLLRLAG